MIPKIIHYCWFGRGPKPQLALDCIESWKKFLPEYKIIEWNEDNFDIDRYAYAKEAYQARKFAFVTDIVRMYALYNYGGVYMDTDVEILKPLDTFLNHAAFSGFESDTRYPTGLMAAEKGSKWAKENLDWYNGKHFIKDDGTYDFLPNVDIIMGVTAKYGILPDNQFQEVPGYFAVYPKDYFCPSNWKTKMIETTENSVCIHHFAGSWQPKPAKGFKRIQVSLNYRLSKYFPFYARLLKWYNLRKRQQDKA